MFQEHKSFLHYVLQYRHNVVFDTSHSPSPYPVHFITVLSENTKKPEQQSVVQKHNYVKEKK